MPSGIFTAPRTGTYFFSFIGFPEISASSSVVAIMVSLMYNGNRIGVGELQEGNTLASQNEQVSLQSTLSLNAGDKIWIEIVGNMSSKGMFLYDSSFHYNHFSGWLLEEEFSLS